MAVGAVVVNYNSGDVLRRCIDSIAAEGLIERTVIVDNASTDGSVRHIPQDWLVENSTNVGFAAAVNRGVAELGEASDEVLLINPDAFLTEGTVRKLLDALGADPKAAAAGPRNVQEDGSSLPPTAWRFPNLIRTMLMDLRIAGGLPGPLKRRWFASYHLRPRGRPVKVDWLFGSCLLVRRDLWKEPIFGLDESFFLYGEELDMFWRASRHGWHCLYVPEAQVIHLEGHSAKQGRTVGEYDLMRLKGTDKACERNMSSLHHRLYSAWNRSRRRKAGLLEGASQV